MYDGILAETVPLVGNGRDLIEAYVARPLGPGPYPGVVLIHHGLGLDVGTKEMVRTFAANGYVTVAPSVFYREGPFGDPDDMAAVVRMIGGIPDEQCIGDVAAALDLVRALPYSNGKVGVIGHCFGGRAAYMAACRLRFDAAVVCYGGGVTMKPEDLTPTRPIAPIDLTERLSSPVLGLFGKEDRSPSVADVERIEAELIRHGKTFEFTSYDNAGHGFFSVERAGYRQPAATDGWRRIFEWYERYLASNE